MKNCDSDDDEDKKKRLETLLKRRRQLAALVECHRIRASTSSSSIENGAGQNQQPKKYSKETMSQVKMTSQHELVQTKHTISSDIIEDTDEETSLSRYSGANVIINSSSENDSNTSAFSITEKFIDNPVKVKQQNPNKTINVLSAVIIKKSSESGEMSYLGTSKDNSTTNSDLTTTVQSKMTSTCTNVTNLNRPMQDTEENIACYETQKDSSDATSNMQSLQQPTISSLTPALPSDTTMILYSHPENYNDESDATSCESLEQPSNLPSTAAEVSNAHQTYSETREDILNASHVALDMDCISQRKRRNTGRTAKKHAYIDFLMSDEDKEDYSAGSSDLWSCNGSDSSSNEIQNLSKKRKKKNDKTETNKEIKRKEKKMNSRKINKKLREEGKPYQNRKGEIMSEKTMKENPCEIGKCARGCYDISEERRKSLFEYFWSLDAQRRKDWIVHCAQKVLIKRKKTKNDLSRRNITYEYYINNGEGHKQVCQKFLIYTLDITQKYIIYNVSNATEEMGQPDKRKPNVQQKYTEEAKMFTKKFIEKLPAVPSHYSRKRSNRTYLPQEMKNVTNLYQMYFKNCVDQAQEALSENAFRTIFKEYNISFHIPKKDKCVTCVKAENNKDQMSERDKELLDIHLREKKASYERFKVHQTLKSNNKTITCSFDLQKVLNTPHGQSMLLYYSRKYSVYNFTIYESETQEVFCYTWGESDGKRGSNEIATCLMKYLEEKDRNGVKHLLMYCDSCTGQNKNKTVLAAMNHFLKSAVNLEVIQINYLLPGHTYMPVDSVHAVIEREIRKLIVWSPSQWPTYFESARKRPRPYKVHVMDYSEFLNFDQIAGNTFTPKTSKDIKLKDIRVATFKKKTTDNMFIKYSMEEDAPTHNIKLCEKNSWKGKGRGKGKSQSKGKKSQPNNESGEEITTVKLYSCRLPIAAAKYKDLNNMCENGTIPYRFHKEYRELPCDSKLRETLNETDEDDEKSDYD